MFRRRAIRPPSRLDFACVGPQRTGTSWTYGYLLHHPGACVSDRVKESFFFDRKYARGFGWYWRHFPEVAPGQVVGEVAPTYFHSPEAVSRLYGHNPDATIVIILREPVSRVVSLHQHLTRIGELPASLPLPAALEAAPLLADSSRYAAHLGMWSDAFGRERVRVLLYEELARDAGAFADSLCTALSLAPEAVPAHLQQPVNPAASVVRGPARLLGQATNKAREAGMHRLVNAVKRSGLRRLLERPGPLRYPPPAVLHEVLARLDVGEPALQSRFGLDLASWRARRHELGIGR